MRANSFDAADCRRASNSRRFWSPVNDCSTVVEADVVGHRRVTYSHSCDGMYVRRRRSPAALLPHLGYPVLGRYDAYEARIAKSESWRLDLSVTTCLTVPQRRGPAAHLEEKLRLRHHESRAVPFNSSAFGDRTGAVQRIQLAYEVPQTEDTGFVVGSIPSYSALVDLLTSADFDLLNFVRNYDLKVLGALFGDESGRGAILQAEQDLRSFNSQVSKVLVSLIGASSSPEREAALIRIARDSSLPPDVRAVAIRQVARHSSGSTIEALHELAQLANNPCHAASMLG